jgi:hypothetical protein
MTKDSGTGPLGLYSKYGAQGVQNLYLLFSDSATLQSMQWIINAAYNQSSLQSTPLYPA